MLVFTEHYCMHFGWYLFSVVLMVGNWVGLGGSVAGRGGTAAVRCLSVYSPGTPRRSACRIRYHCRRLPAWRHVIVTQYLHHLQYLAVSASTLLVGPQREHPTCKKIKWWGAGVVMPHHLLSHLIQTGLPFWYRLTLQAVMEKTVKWV